MLARGLKRFIYAGISARDHAHPQLQGIQSIVEAVGLYCTLQPVDGLHNSSYETWAQSSEERVACYQTVERPVGVIAMSDIVARALVPTIVDAGLEIPNNAAIVSTGDGKMAASDLHPTLSSIDMGYHRVGCEAAQLLARTIAGEPLHPIVTTVPPKGLIT